MQRDDRILPKGNDDFSVGLFRPGDAEGVALLFRSVYGESYPFRLFYEPEALTAANAEGRVYTVVARSGSGQVIGVANLYGSAPCKSLYEWGAGLVLKEYRNAGISYRLSDFVSNTLASGTPGIEETFGEAVCNHTHLQKSYLVLGYTETGIELALMPAEAYTAERSAAGRVATVVGFRCFAPKPHRIFLPPRYEGILQRIYERLDDRRETVIARDPLPPGRSTTATMSVFDFARVARIFIPASGSDLAGRISELEDEARKQKVLVFQAFLNLTEPWAGEVAGILRKRGYIFGGALPRWFDGDGLLMQKLECPPGFEDIALLSDFSKELLAFIREDQER